MLTRTARRAVLLVTLATAVAVLSGCSTGDNPTLSSKSPTPTATPSASAAPCTPSGTGTTDLSKKPVIAKPTGPAPQSTTVVDIVCGTGATAAVGSNVAVKYVGVLYSTGTEFDSSWKVSPSNTLPFTVGSGVITGFSTGVEGMRVGGRREIIIPPADGYGSQANGPIPAGSTLIFVIDLVSVT